MLLQLSLSILQYTKMMKLTTALRLKKKMLVAVHISTIYTVQREPEILNNCEIKGFMLHVSISHQIFYKLHGYSLFVFSIYHKAVWIGDINVIEKHTLADKFLIYSGSLTLQIREINITLAQKLLSFLDNKTERLRKLIYSKKFGKISLLVYISLSIKISFEK